MLGFLRKRREQTHKIRVNLPEGRERHFFGAECRLKELAILQGVLAHIPIGESQIQHFLAAERAHAFRSRAESILQPRKFGDLRYLQDAQSSVLTLKSVVRRSCPALFASQRALSCHRFLYRG